MTDSTAGSWAEWENWIQGFTERWLTWRRKRRDARKARQKKRNPVVDWLDAILSAVVIVLVINQYLLQAYQIPSESMLPSLQVTDRIFVNKYVYGPELVPGMLKLPSPWQPARGDVIIFESPTYLSVGGPLKDILQRVVYMVTLSFVDIDKDENGQPKHHFLVKRAIGMPGDRIRMNRGFVEYLTPGSSVWMTEAQLKTALGFTYPDTRLIKPDQYPEFKAAGTGEGKLDNGLPVSSEQENAIKKYFVATSDSAGKVTNYSTSMRALADEQYVDLWRAAASWAVEPDNFAAGAEWRRLKEGYDVPEGRLFPMGDNRDNSLDARYFGPVRLEKVLGKGLFRYWPLNRIGGVR
jgi:signal peptidase I